MVQYLKADYTDIKARSQPSLKKAFLALDGAAIKITL
jgi:hypothetical protein